MADLVLEGMRTVVDMLMQELDIYNKIQKEKEESLDP